MAIEFTCTDCSRKLRVAENVAGKRIKCPKCKAVVRVPTDGGSLDSWYLKAEDGNDYGPVPKDEMDGWVAEGRVTADCQLLQEGAEQWRWATDVYPQLMPSKTATPPAPPQPAPAAPAASNNPFVGLSDGAAPAKSAANTNPFDSVGASPTSGSSGSPFAFGEKTSSASTTPRSSSRGRGGRRKKGNGKRSGIVTVVAVLLFLSCASMVIGAIAIVALGSTFAAIATDAGYAELAATGGGIFILIALGALLLGVFYGYTGYLLTQRSEVGRIIAICIFGLSALGQVAAVIGMIVSAGLLGLALAIPVALVGGGITGFALWVLLNRDIAAEFG
ncbi:MAG: hypothetical protein ACI9G1_000788 [Pirellulaceae bacterium]|jgi:hypothetical protein